MRRENSPATSRMFLIEPKSPPDPMPTLIEPCLAKPSARVPVGPDWLYEIKWDGYRVLVYISPDGVRVMTRGGENWTVRFPGIVASAQALGVETAILDGEAVILDDQGRSDFNRLQRAVGAHRFMVNSTEIVMYAFDLLHLDGHDLRQRPLEDRKALLERLLPEGHGSIRFSEAIEGDGMQFFEAARDLGLEGIVAKRRGGRYRSGRGGDWLKIKCLHRAHFYVIGYAVTVGGISKLLLGRKDVDGMTYVGSVGTGFTRQAAKELLRSLEAVKDADPLAKVRGKMVRLHLPLIIAEVDFSGWTAGGKLRHASFKSARVADGED